MFQCFTVSDEYFNIYFSLNTLICGSRAKTLLILSSLHLTWILLRLLLCLVNDLSPTGALEAVHFLQF